MHCAAVCFCPFQLTTVGLLVSGSMTRHLTDARLICDANGAPLERTGCCTKSTTNLHAPLSYYIYNVANIKFTFTKACPRANLNRAFKKVIPSKVNSTPPTF